MLRVRSQRARYTRAHTANGAMPNMATTVTTDQPLCIHQPPMRPGAVMAYQPRTPRQAMYTIVPASWVHGDDRKYPISNAAALEMRRDRRTAGRERAQCIE